MQTFVYIGLLAVTTQCAPHVQDIAILWPTLRAPRSERVKDVSPMFFYILPAIKKKKINENIDYIL